MKKELNAWAKVIHKDNAMKGFWDDEVRILEYIEDDSYFTNEEKKLLKSAFVAKKLALVHSEVSEALEADRKDLMDDKLTHRKGIEVELADALIRILDMAGGYDLDIGGAVEEKLAYNKTREFKHGKKY